ncbi:MAG TPA: hypothetical protein VEC12_13525 [Bacteroidia bacterium]|nr:hypothetical protein [Bacteroidia bacterium]
MCTNGYGHFKRVTHVCAHLVRQYPGIQVNIFCAAFHLTNTQNWSDVVFLSGKSSVKFFTAPMDDAPTWGNNYTLNRYTLWRQSLLGIKELSASQLVISDNYTAPLGLFAKVALMGSFLWHNILQNTGNDGQVINFEKQVLDEAGKPPMICQAGMAMPAVLNQTQALPMPWFCERVEGQPEKTTNTGNILVTGGGTTLSDAVLLECLAELIKKTGLTVFTDSKLFNKSRDAGLPLTKFSYTDEDFAALDMIVCRPGIGILTDAVKYKVPVMCMAESGNPEMDFNSLRVNELGIGKNMMGFTADRVVETINQLYAKTELQHMRTNIAGLATGGAVAAADYIYSQL